MDARVKPGHDAEYFAAHLRIQFNFQTANAPPPVFFAAPGRPSSFPAFAGYFVALGKSRGDGAPGGASFSFGPTFVLAWGGASRRSIAASSGTGRAFGRGHSPPAPSASSWRGTLVCPGGARCRPGSGGSVHPPPAGATSDPANITPHDSALGGPDAANINPPRRAGISSHAIVIMILAVARGGERPMSVRHDPIPHHEASHAHPFDRTLAACPCFSRREA
jgi:hypothetical protein